MAWNSEIGRPNCLRSFGVFERGVVGALRHADGKRGDRNAAAIENAQAVDEALAWLAEQLRLRDAAIGEDHFAGGAGAEAEFVFLFAGAKTGRVFSGG